MCYQLPGMKTHPERLDVRELSPRRPRRSKNGTSIVAIACSTTNGSSQRSTRTGLCRIGQSLLDRADRNHHEGDTKKERNVLYPSDCHSVEFRCVSIMLASIEREVFSPLSVCRRACVCLEHSRRFLSVLVCYQEARGRRAEAENDREANQKTATHVRTSRIWSSQRPYSSTVSPVPLHWCDGAASSALSSLSWFMSGSYFLEHAMHKTQDASWAKHSSPACPCRQPSTDIISHGTPEASGCLAYPRSPRFSFQGGPTTCSK